MLQTKYLFALDGDGKPIAGTMLQYDDTPITATNADGTTTTEPAPIPHYPPEYTHEGDESVWNAQHRARYVNGAWAIDPVDPAAELQAAKDAKYAELQAAASVAMETFASSALGSPHTYLTGYGKGNTDFLMLETEDRYMQGPDWDGNPILWYTVEAGDVEHSKVQLHQVYLDGRASGQTVKYKAKQLLGQAAAVQIGTGTLQAALDAVAAIVW